VRLEDEKIAEFVGHCTAGDPSSKRLPVNYRVFVDPQSWRRLWNEYGLPTPHVDFKKHRVAAVIQEGFGIARGTRIRHITYNPAKKRTLVRLNQMILDASSVRLLGWGCDADFVIFPPAPGEVIFR
jgi:hypothetical protein